MIFTAGEEVETANRLFPQLGLGLGLRPRHYRDILAGPVEVSWFEAISENYLDAGGRPLFYLKKIREQFPIALHGVSLSIGSTDPLNFAYLKRLKNLIGTIQPVLVSDHCSWSTFQGQNSHDLLPLPYTEEALEHVAERVLRVQDFLGRRILLENVSSYLEFAPTEMSEAEFLSALAESADCGILLDVNNVNVNAVNHGLDPIEFLDRMPVNRIGQVHLAGHSVRVHDDGSQILIDTHDHPVPDGVWSLYQHLIQRTGDVSTMVEWDAEIPEFAQLQEEVRKIRELPNHQVMNDATAP